jgi:hypothetical protein
MRPRSRYSACSPRCAGAPPYNYNLSSLTTSKVRVWDALVWDALVWDGLVWDGLVWGRACVGTGLCPVQAERSSAARRAFKTP